MHGRKPIGHRLLQCIQYYSSNVCAPTSKQLIKECRQGLGANGVIL